MPGYWGSSGPSHLEQECRRGEKGGENHSEVKKIMKEQLDNSGNFRVEVNAKNTNIREKVKR